MKAPADETPIDVQRMLDAVPMITQGYDSLKSVNEILYADDVEQNGTSMHIP